jgi:hypothetical protein
MNLLFTRQTKIFITEIYNISKHPSSLAKVIFIVVFTSQATVQVINTMVSDGKVKKTSVL